MRIAVVVHPTRPIDGALDALRNWTGESGSELVQLATGHEDKRQVAEFSEVDSRDVVVALGGDGTVLKSLQASAASSTPVLGVACGSLGALTSVRADGIGEALERFRAGDWTPRPVPALAIDVAGSGREWAFNDLVIVRRGAGQLAASIAVDEELYVRLAGDGLIAATALGSSAYTMAVGGPVLAAATPAFVCTPLAMHGGTAPPLVVPATSKLSVDVHPGYAGFDVEIDGHRREGGGQHFELTLHTGKATLVTFAPPGHGITALRKRRLIADSPRILARDDRAAHRPG